MTVLPMVTAFLTAACAIVAWVFAIKAAITVRRTHRILNPVKPPPVCRLCGAPATVFSQPVARPETGWNEPPATYTCDTHETYLDNHVWRRSGDGPWVDTGPSRESNQYTRPAARRGRIATKERK